MKNTAPSANELVQTIRNTLILEWINLQSAAKFSSACIFNESHTVQELLQDEAIQSS